MSGITKEIIVAAAISKDGKVWSVPKPGRHNDVILLICNELNILYVGCEYHQGFLTSKGRFVERMEAARIAYEAGQITEKKYKLYSEDLW